MTLTVTISGITSNSADMSAKLTGSNSSYTGYRYIRFWIQDPATAYSTTWEFESVSQGGSSSSWSETITTCGPVDLEPETTYKWAARLGELVNGEIVWSDDVTDSGTFVTLASDVEKPELWDWEALSAYSTYYDILMGDSPAATVNASGKLTACYLLCTVWNAMCGKVYSMRRYRGKSWNSSILSFGETEMPNDDKALTADRLNSLLLNVDSIVSTGLSQVSPGDVVKGRYQIVIMQKCNQAIEEG